jgi:hypothetical protein
VDAAELRDDDLHDKRMAQLKREREEREAMKAENERLRATVEAAAMAKTRLDHFADHANAGKVHYDARELKRKIWGAFAEFDACQQKAGEK